MKFFSVILSYLSTFALPSLTSPRCKCTPNSPCWPTSSSWSHLNYTLRGALLYGIPPGAVCYPSHPTYDPSSCAIVLSQWTNSRWHAAHPVSVDNPIVTNNSCNPIYANGTSVAGDVHAGKKGCAQGAYPVYVVNATTASQVSVGLEWAKQNNIRVVVKSTGHSITGHSVGASSLSIWTHYLRGISYISDFTPTSCKAGKGVQAARIAAGHTVIDVLRAMAKHNAVAITGANPSVGIVGWLTGGGHGPLTQTYGMGVDQLLEARIVTPGGEELVTNACQHPDLFFAIRGGGGGTFGVVTEVVVRVYPSPKTTRHSFTVTSQTETTEIEFYGLMGFVHKELQRLKEGGMQGYYYIAGPPYVPTLSFTWTFWLFEKPAGTLEKLMKPIEDYLNVRTGLFTYEQATTYAETYLDIYNGTYTNEPVATGSSAYGSRLMSPESFAEANRIASVLEKIGPSNDASQPNAPSSNPILIGHMIAPSHRPSYFPSTISLNPAWRNTLAHLLIVSAFSDNSPPSLIDAVYADMTHNKVAALRELSPRTGAYFNEADVNEVNWQESFWGSNYGRLRRTKKRYDGEGVLWCRGCVGSEEWEEGERDLCRVKGGMATGKGRERGKDEL